MNIAEFEDLLDRFGADITGWPVPQQQAASEFLQSSAEARAVLAQEQLLRHALSAPPVRATAGLTERIMQAVREGGADPAAVSPKTSSDESKDVSLEGSSQRPGGSAEGGSDR